MSWLGCELGRYWRGAGVMVTNQLMFQPPLVALMPKGIEPALKVTVCETVVQLCQAPVEGMLRVPYTGVPPALSSCNLPPPLKLATRYDTVYTPVVGIVTAHRWYFRVLHQTCTNSSSLNSNCSCGRGHKSVATGSAESEKQRISLYVSGGKGIFLVEDEPIKNKFMVASIFVSYSMMKKQSFRNVAVINN